MRIDQEIKRADLVSWAAGETAKAVTLTAMDRAYLGALAALMSANPWLSNEPDEAVTVVELDNALLGLNSFVDIDALNAQIATLTADKAALQLQITGLNSQITQLNADKVTLNNKIALLDDTMTYFFNNISTGPWSVSFWSNTTSNNTSNIAQFITQNGHLLYLSKNGLIYDGVQKTTNTANTWIFWQFTAYNGNLYVYKNCVLVATLAVGYVMLYNNFVKRSTECMIANLTCYLTTSYVFSSPPTRET